MSANPHANGGLLLRDLRLPTSWSTPSRSPPGRHGRRGHPCPGQYLRDVLRRNAEHRNFRIFDPTRPPRTAGARSSRPRPLLPRRDRSDDDHVSPDGRVLEVLSEHQCQGWLEGYLLTGRHGFFNCYEAFIHIVDSMFNQHAKWLKVAREIPWRRSIASLNYLLTSHVWRQDHNGFSHQDPGFIDAVVNKKAEIIRVYLPPDANTLLWVTDRCLRSRDSVNVIVAGKQPAPQWLDMDAAVKHCTAGIASGVGEQRSRQRPDVVMACCGTRRPSRRWRRSSSCVSSSGSQGACRHVVDLMKLVQPSEHPHGLPDRDFDELFTTDNRSSSRSTATRGSSTGSPTGGPTTTTCTSAATRKKARPPRRSTWWC